MSLKSFCLFGAIAALQLLPAIYPAVATAQAQLLSIDYTKGNSGSSSAAKSVTTDIAGNTYVAGSFTGTIVFGTSETLVSNGNDDIFVAKYSDAGQFLWVFSIGGAGNDMATDIKVDANEMIYLCANITGSYGTSIDADPSNRVNNITGASAVQSQDMMIAKYNGAVTPSNTSFYQWAFCIGGSGSDNVSQLTLGKDGMLYLGGSIAATNTIGIDADPSRNTKTITGSSALMSSDMFVAKYNGNLSPANTSFYQWAFTTGSTGADKIRSIALDTFGMLYVAGEVSLSNVSLMDADPSANAGYVTGASSLSNTDVFVAKYDAGLNPASPSFYQWAFIVGGTGNDYPSNIKISSSGMLYVVGSINSSTAGYIDMDPGKNTNNIAGVSNTIGSDIFLVKYDATKKPSDAGFYKWAFAIGGAGFDAGTNVETDDKYVYVTGYVNASATTPIDADPSDQQHSISGIAGTNGTDVFIAKYDADQSPASASFYQWAFVAGASGYDVSSGLALDGFGGVIIAGSFTGTKADFDPLKAGSSISSANNGMARSAFISRYFDGCIWTGAKNTASNNWDNYRNWSHWHVPDATSNVYIPNVSYAPSITGFSDINIRNLKIEQGTNFEIQNGATLVVTHNLSNNGSITGEGHYITDNNNPTAAGMANYADKVPHCTRMNNH